MGVGEGEDKNGESGLQGKRDKIGVIVVPQDVEIENYFRWIYPGSKD